MLPKDRTSPPSVTRTRYNNPFLSPFTPSKPLSIVNSATWPPVGNGSSRLIPSHPIPQTPLKRVFGVFSSRPLVYTHGKNHANDRQKTVNQRSSRPKQIAILFPHLTPITSCFTLLLLPTMKDGISASIFPEGVLHDR